MRVIEVPNHTWETFYQRIAVEKLATQNGKKIVAVQTFQYEGFNYVGVGALFPGKSSGKPNTLYSYKLLPSDLYKGEKTVLWHDSAAIAKGTRQRGCHLGLVVSERGHKMVCVEAVHFLSSQEFLPPTSHSCPLGNQISLF